MTKNSTGPKIVAKVFASEMLQYAFIAKEIYEIVRDSHGMLTFADFSILARTNRELEFMKIALDRFEIELSLVATEEYVSF
jgi:hypothetical protein